MEAVCAWCGRMMTEGKPEEPEGSQVSHGICPECSRRFFPSGVRYVVVPRDRAFLVPEIEKAFQAVLGIRVILDRRRCERRRCRTRIRNDRRVCSRDRRQLLSPIVGAVPAVAGLWVPADRPSSSGRWPTRTSQSGRSTP